jgi:hypothetical protein
MLRAASPPHGQKNRLPGFEVSLVLEVLNEMVISKIRIVLQVDQKHVRHGEKSQHPGGGRTERKRTLLLPTDCAPRGGVQSLHPRPRHTVRSHRSVFGRTARFRAPSGRAAETGGQNNHVTRR